MSAADPQASQPWIRSASFDGILILAPALFAAAVVWLLRDTAFATSETPLLGWFVLVVAVDVAHVYSTLYRTYFDGAELRRRPVLYAAVPLFAWVAGVILYGFGGGVFWRVLAYLAAYHFVRQQYGFLMLYKRRERGERRWERRLDQAMIYLATIYPLIYWHTHERVFSWFIDGDFVSVDAPYLHGFALTVYLTVIAAYVAKEVARFVREKRVNVPKNLLVFGTAASWYVGIVALDGDLAFTMTNVVAHGIPYVALIWAYGKKQAPRRERLGIARRTGAFWFSWRWLPAFVLVLVFFAYVEEGLWDALVWRDHELGFPLFSWLPQLSDEALLTLVVPLLAVPQATHYVLDGYIWRLRAVSPRLASRAGVQQAVHGVGETR